MATIREKAPYQWAVQIRRRGWPNQSATFRTKKDAQAWARRVESEMDRGQFIDQSGAQQATLGDLIRLYLKEVTDRRPGEESRIAERSRLERFLRDETALCSYAAAHLTPEHFEDYRDRRLAQPVSRGKRPPKNAKKIAPGTVKRELTLLKRVIDHRKRRLGLLINPVNTEDVKRPAVNDARDVRLTKDELGRLLTACAESRVPWLRPFVELALETGARRGNLLRLCWRDIDFESRSALLRGIKNSRSPGTVIDHPVGLPNETGGVLLGVVDIPNKSIHLVEALPAPPDSTGTAAGFTRGTHGVQEALDHALDQTMGQVRYVGEWHSHPPRSGAMPSATDLCRSTGSQLYSTWIPAVPSRA